MFSFFITEAFMCAHHCRCFISVRDLKNTLNIRAVAAFEAMQACIVVLNIKANMTEADTACVDLNNAMNDHYSLSPNPFPTNFPYILNEAARKTFS